MEQFKQLMIADNGAVTERQQKFRDLHNEIMFSMTRATEYAIIVAESLKKVRDDRLFEEAGFADFEEYAEQACGFKRRQALNYISVIERLSGEYLNQNRGLGITKLITLSTVSEGDREIIEESVDLESVTVAQLQETIRQLEAEKAEATKQLEMNLGEVESKVKKAEKDAKDKANAKITKLQSEITALKGKEPEKVVVQDEKVVAELAQNKEILAQKEAELERLKKQHTLAADESFLKFKVTFETFQKLSVDLVAQLNALGADKQEGARNAVKALIGGLAI